MTKKILEKIYMQTNIVKAAVAALIITSCGGGKSNTETPAAAEKTTSLSDQLMMGTLWMQKSEEAAFLKRQAYEFAALKLEANMKKGEATKPLAVILDLDETVLDNSPYEARLILKGQNYKSASWEAWVNEANAEAVPGAVEFLQKANGMGVEIFYVSNRNESHLDPTVENLQRLELPFADPEHVLLKRDESSDKTERRETVKERFKVVLLVGDQMGDFTQEPLMEIDAIRDGYVSPLMDSAQAYFIMLPNPLYGSFESTLYGDQSGLSDEAKKMYRRKALNPKKDIAR